MRKKQKKWTVLLMLLLAAFLSIPCIQPVQAATPRLNKTKVTLAKGAQIKLKVSGTKAKVKWSADKRKVATVTSKGVVTAKGKGVARITAKIGKRKLVCRVTVETPKLNKSRLMVNVGKTAALKLTGTKGKARWYTTDASVATVTQKGVVRGVRAGSCRVYAKVNGGTLLCAVSVKNERKPLFESQEECGSGTFYIYFASGTSEGGKIPETYVDSKYHLGYVSYCAYDVDNSVPIRVYLDGRQIDMDYVGFKKQASIPFSGDDMEKGIHTVEMVQFEGNDVSKTVIAYRKAKFRVLYR